MSVIEVATFCTVLNDCGFAVGATGTAVTNIATGLEPTVVVAVTVLSDV